MDSTVVTEVRGRVLVIELNRPQQRNAIDASVAQGVASALDELEARDDLSVAVITGRGGVFSAGMDLKAFRRGESAHASGRGFAGIVEAPPAKPLIAAVEGWALGGGFEIALSCDIIVASRTARFGLPEVRRGVAARGGGAFRLPKRVPYSAAMEMLLTGEPLSAEAGHRLGLVNRLTDEGEALQAALELAEMIARNAPLAVIASKKVVIESADWTAAEAFQAQRALLDPVFSSADAQEGATAFVERRPARWSGR